MAGQNLSFDILAVDKASKVFDKIGGHASSLGGKVGKAGKAMSLALGGAAVAGVGALGFAFVGAVKDATSLQQTIAQTNAVIKSTSGAAGVSAQHIRDLSNSINDYSNMDDEVIQKGANMLLTFKNLRNEAGKGNDIFDQSTKVLADMTTALGSDPQKQAIQLGKALNDPVKGISALARVGVTFTAGQKKTIKSLVDSGNLMGAQKVILKELNSEFGGSAKAAGDTFGGAMFRLKDALQDTLRDAVLPLLPALSRLVGWFGPKLTSGIKFAVDAIQLFVGSFTGAGADVDMGKFMNPIIDAGATARTVFDRLIVVIKGVWSWVKSDLAPALEHLGQQVFPALKSAVASITKTLIQHKDIFVFLGTVLTQIILPIVGQVAKAVLTVLGPAFKMIAWIASNVVIPALKFLIGMWINMVSYIIDGAAKAFGWIPGIGPKLKKAASDFDKFRIGVNAALTGIKDQTVNLKVVASINGSTKLSNQAKAKALEVAFRAAGGPVKAGQPYVVGEQGPELFVPGQSGGIVPNGKTSRSGAAGGGSAPIQLIVNYVGGSTPGEQAKFGRFVEQSLQRLGRPVQVKTAG